MTGAFMFVSIIIFLMCFYLFFSVSDINNEINRISGTVSAEFLIDRSNILLWSEETSSHNLIGSLNELKTGTQNIQCIIAVFAISVVLLLPALGLFYSNVILKPLAKIRETLFEIGRGKLGNRLEAQSDDEIGLLCEEINVLSKRLEIIIVDTLRKISEGEFEIESYLINDDNEIGMAFKKMLRSLKMLYSDLNFLSNASVEGELAIRADASKHKGNFRKIIQSMNLSFDVLVTQLNTASVYFDMIANGDIPPEIQRKYSGDYREFISNLNSCVNSISMLVEDIGANVPDIHDGRILMRKDPQRHRGVFRKVVQGTNDIFDDVLNSRNVCIR